MQNPVCFDLTELLHPGTGRLRHYGIATVVRELAIELFLDVPAIRFVVFSPGHGRFFEVFPERDDASYGGVRLNVPYSRFFLKTRIVPRRQRGFAAALSPIAQFLIRSVNRQLWNQNDRSSRSITLEGATLLAAGRPKVLAQMIEHLPASSDALRFIPVLYDLIPLQEFFEQPNGRFPSSFFDDMTRVINRADRIVASSGATLDVLRRLADAGVLSELPSAAAVPLAHEYRAAGNRPSIELPQEPYLLVVGPQTGRKNIEIVFDAMALLASTSRKMPKLVLAGADRPRTRKCLLKPAYSRIRSRVEFFVDPDHSDLEHLYRNALAVVLPSKIEGWGLPAAEALWLQTPAICAEIPVLREVCGSKAFYFDPCSAEQLTDIISGLMSGTARSPAKGLQASREPDLRTWRTVADDLLAQINATGE